MSEVKHTPIPWHVDECEDDNVPEFIYARDGRGVAGTDRDRPVAENRANAEHIVRCVNSHEELVEALAESAALLMTLCIVANNKAIHEHLPYGLLEEVEAWLRGNKAQAALAKAGRP